MLASSIRFNMKNAGSKLGQHRREAETALAEFGAEVLAKSLRYGQVITLAGIPLELSDFLIEYTAPDGWKGGEDLGTQFMFDTRITPELKAEGLARDVIRLVQDARKNAKLDVSDRIELYLGTDAPDLAAAIAAHRATIAGETQAARWADAPLTGDAYTAEPKKLDGHPLTIALRKV
jgi:isoleucyl-tRNA synthetase